MTPRTSAILAVLAALLAAVLWIATGSGVTPTAPAPAGRSAPVPEREVDGDRGAATGASVQRAAATGAGSAEDPMRDPAFRAALSGFKGRVVDERGLPQKACAVRFYRADPELLQFEGLFAGAAPERIRLEIHEGTTGDDGRFEITGAWPRSFYVLEADAGEVGMLRVPVERVPGPGEVVDLGDVVVPRLGVITGRVVDEGRKGVPGVAVFAQDIPGAFLELAPVEHFDPEGAVVARPGRARVIELPPIVKRIHDLVLRPTTVTGPDGRFRLQGVQPGDNSMLFKLRGLVPALRKGVRVEAGEEKDVGDIEMSEGETAFVKVIDADEAPVARADVLIGPTTLQFPADFATRAGATDARGELQVGGLPKGRVTVAARRSRNHPWVCSEPANVNGDLVVRLPSRHHFDLLVKSAVGRDIVRPEFRLMPDVVGERSLVFGVLGAVQWIDVSDKVARLEDGRFRIPDLERGRYSIAVIAPGHAAGKLDFQIEKSAAGELTLAPEVRCVVQVVDPDGAPVRHAKVYVRSPRAGGAPLVDLPITAGLTRRDGTLEVREGKAGPLLLSASHPAWGMAHARATLPSEGPILLQMVAPAELYGRLTEAGREPTPGKWTIVVEPRGGGRGRGAMPDLPEITVAGLDGSFQCRGLLPGEYRLRVVPSVTALNSPGGAIGFFTRMRLSTGNSRKDVELRAGEPTYVELDAIAQAEVIDGPAARVSGTVFVDGRPAAGVMVTGRGTRRVGVSTDDAGRFDFGSVPAGPLRVTVRDLGRASMVDMRMDGHLWERGVAVEAGKDVVLDVQLSTGRVSGRVTLDGVPAGEVRVLARGGVAKAEDRPASSARIYGTTDQRGGFSFEGLPSGRYRIEVTDRAKGYGTSPEVEVLPGGLAAGVEIALAKAHAVSGRVDLSVVAGEQRPRFGFLRMRQIDGGREQSASVSRDGVFRARGVPPGRYEVRVFLALERGRPSEFAVEETVTVVDRDVEGVVLKPRRKPDGNKR